MKKYFVYLLECKNENDKISYYCGYTSRKPQERLKEHLANSKNNKKKHYTGRQKSLKLVYFETYEDMQTAKKREREIKKLGTRYKKKLIFGKKS